MKKYLIILSIIISIFISIIVVVKLKLSKDRNYLLLLNLQLQGNVENISPLKQGHDFGIISINLTKTNINYYDERSTTKRYFGVIKNGKASIIVENISSFKKDDVFYLKGIEYKIYRKGKLIEENIYGLPSNIFNPYVEINSIFQTQFYNITE